MGIPLPQLQRPAWWSPLCDLRCLLPAPQLRPSQGLSPSEQRPARNGMAPCWAPCFLCFPPATSRVTVLHLCFRYDLPFQTCKAHRHHQHRVRHQTQLLCMAPKFPLNKSSHKAPFHLTHTMLPNEPVLQTKGPLPVTTPAGCAACLLCVRERKPRSPQSHSFFPGGHTQMSSA